MKLIRIDFPHPHRASVQVRFCGCRVHHGLVGLLLVLHDRRDWRRWLTDLIPRAEG